MSRIADHLPSYAEAVKTSGTAIGGTTAFDVDVANVVGEHATTSAEAGQTYRIDNTAQTSVLVGVHANEHQDITQLDGTGTQNIAASGGDEHQLPLAPGDVPPPSYESLFGRAVREVREESHCGDSGGFTRSVSRVCKLFCGACDWVLWLIVILFIPLYCVVISILYAGKCSGVPFLPMWLLVVGVIPTFKVVLRILARVFKIARQGFSTGFSEPFSEHERRWMSFGDDYLIIFWIFWFASGYHWKFACDSWASKHTNGTASHIVHDKHGKFYYSHDKSSSFDDGFLSVKCPCNALLYVSAEWTLYLGSLVVMPIVFFLCCYFCMKCCESCCTPS